MFGMRMLAPSVNRLIADGGDPGCSPVGVCVPWCLVPERLWEFAPSAEASLGVLVASLSHGKRKPRLSPYLSYRNAMHNKKQKAQCDVQLGLATFACGFSGAKVQKT